MPAKAPKPCRTCKQATANTNGYCDKHQDNAVGWNQRKSHWKGKGSTRKWRTTRERILKRDNYMCVPCFGKGIYTPATEVDHIICKGHGGTDADDNLQSICKPCHEAKTLAESRLPGGGQISTGPR